MAATNNDVVENLLYVYRVVHRKILKGGLEGADNISRPLFQIMMTLNEYGTMRVSEIGRRLFIPKPQMTHLIDKLTSLGLVERQPDARDRRITNISLTPDGKNRLDTYRRILRANIKKKLSILNKDELEELSVALKTLRVYGSRFE